MPLGTYPATLPGVLPGSYTARGRLAQSEIPGSVALRRRFADPSGSRFAASWSYSPEQMAIWRTWFDTTLRRGQLWFLIELPGRSGMVPTPARFVEVTQDRKDGGEYLVTATLQLRGR